MSILKANRIENLTTTDGGINVNNSGNVGIGRTSPESRLHIDSGSGNQPLVIQASGNTAAYVRFKNSADQNGYIAYNNSAFAFWTSNSERLRIDSSGRVAIGHTSPSDPLHVKGASGIQFSIDTPSGGQYTQMSFRNNGTQKAALWWNNTASSLVNYVASGAFAWNISTEKMRLDSSGNLGIGTSSPSSFNSDGRNLVVGTGSGGQGMSIYSGNSSYGTIYFADGTSGDALYQGGVLYNHASNFMRLDTAGAERLRIDSSGNVGIGTSSPTSYGNSQATLVIEDDTNPAICWSDTGQTRDWWAVANGSNLSFNYADGGGSGSASNVTSALSMDNSGNVGIGTAVPNYPLHLNRSGSTAVYQQFTNGSTGTGSSDGLQVGINTSGDGIVYHNENKAIRVFTNGSERARFLAAGGLTFNGDTAAANALEDYEEGTFTPAFSFSNLSVSSYQVQQGSYIKVGHIVHVSVYIRFSGSNLSGTPSTGGAVYINLPVTGGTKYSDTQYLSEPAALGRLAEFRGTNDSTNFDRIYSYIGNTSSSMYFGVNKQPCSPQGTDFLYGMSEKSFNGLIGVSNNFEYRHSFTYESSS